MIFCPNVKLLLYISVILLRCVGELRCSSTDFYALREVEVTTYLHVPAEVIREGVAGTY